jgi:putative hemolysin
MRSEGYHMAVIVDEYGGSSGIVTIDQLIEEIVGEIEQEIVGAEKQFEIMRDGTFRILGSMRFDEANEKLGLGLPEGDYTTMGGFALNLFGHLPQKGERAVHGDLDFLASEVGENKIIRLSVTRLEKAEATGAAAGIDPSETEPGTQNGSSTATPSGAADREPVGGVEKPPSAKRARAAANEGSTRKEKRPRKR